MILRARLLQSLLVVISLTVIVQFLYLWSTGIHIHDGSFRQNHSSEDGRPALHHFIKSSYDWGNFKPHFPISFIAPLPSGTPTPQPRIQHDFQPESAITRLRLDAYRLEVKKAFQKCWKSYRKYAWMKDELTPLTGRGRNAFGGWATTLVDSLDTLWIMGFEKEFDEAVKAVAAIDFAKTDSTAVNTFETTIRYLGGLLSAYDLSKEEVLLLKAIEIGDLLYVGFDTPNGFPPFWVNFDKAKSGNLTADDNIPLASPGSLCLEFTRLSQLSGNSKYYGAINRITLLMEAHQNLTRLPGMWPVFIDLQNVDFHGNNHFSLGANSDSAYEYLPKMHAILGGLEPVYAKMADFSLNTIEKNLLFRPMLPNKNEILFAGDVRVSKSGAPYLEGEVQHLTCFAGGFFALSGRLFDKEEYVDIGAKLTKGCIWAYDAFPTGIMPEIFNMLPCTSRDVCDWDEDRWRNDGEVNLPKGFKNARVPSYLLRPEAIESVFILYRITGRKEYQDAAWMMFKSIMAATETKYGNAAIDDVTVEGVTSKKDSMESFWLAETLKYFYLIFSPPDLISLDEYVFSTEAHPLQRPK